MAKTGRFFPFNTNDFSQGFSSWERGWGCDVALLAISRDLAYGIIL